MLGRLAAIASPIDGGQTWRPLPSLLGSDANAVLGLALRVVFRDPTERWLLALGQPSTGFQPKALFHTQDGSSTWTKRARSHTWSPQSSAQGFPDLRRVFIVAGTPTRRSGTRGLRGRGGG